MLSLFIVHEESGMLNKLFQRFFESPEERFGRLLAEASAGELESIGELELELDKVLDEKKLNAINAVIKKAELPSDIFAWQATELRGLKQQKKTYACVLWLQGVMLAKNNKLIEAKEYYALAAKLNYGPAIFAATATPTIKAIVDANYYGSKKAFGSKIVINNLSNPEKIALAKTCYAVFIAVKGNNDFIRNILLDLSTASKTKFSQPNPVLTDEELSILYYTAVIFPDKRAVWHKEMYTEALLPVLIETLIASYPDQFEKLFQADKLYGLDEEAVTAQLKTAKENKLNLEGVSVALPEKIYKEGSAEEFQNQQL